MRGIAQWQELTDAQREQADYDTKEICSGHDVFAIEARMFIEGRPRRELGFLFVFSVRVKLIPLCEREVALSLSNLGGSSRPRRRRFGVALGIWQRSFVGIF